MLHCGVLLQDQTQYGFRTKWTVSGDATARTITLPLIQNRTEGALAYNFVVYWGDGSSSVVTAYNDTNRIHVYATNGTYEVEIIGTCEGWSFNNSSSAVKVVEILNWGHLSKFNGFNYIRSGFKGCTNLTKVASGGIKGSIGSDGFQSLFESCGNLVSVPGDLFMYQTSLVDFAFSGTFYQCVSLASIPEDLFRYNTSLRDYAFQNTFYNCRSVPSIPANLFRYNIALRDSAFVQTFMYCDGLTSIPADLFRYNTSLRDAAFNLTFGYGMNLVSIPTDLFRYNIALYGGAFVATFRECGSLIAVPNDLFRYNVGVTGFSYCFHSCYSLQLNPNIFYADGEQSTRFASLPAFSTVSFNECFNRIAFLGTQGTAPDIWNCDCGEVMYIDVAPATSWDPGDTITGQSSGATVVIVSKTSALQYKVKQHFGTFTSGEIIGVTGVPAKLADQTGGLSFSYTPTSTSCFAGAGNSLTSIDNYADIPANWK